MSYNQQLGDGSYDPHHFRARSHSDDRNSDEQYDPAHPQPIITQHELNYPQNQFHQQTYQLPTQRHQAYAHVELYDPVASSSAYAPPAAAAAAPYPTELDPPAWQNWTTGQTHYTIPTHQPALQHQPFQHQQWPIHQQSVSSAGSYASSSHSQLAQPQSPLDLNGNSHSRSHSPLDDDLLHKLRSVAFARNMTIASGSGLPLVKPPREMVRSGSVAQRSNAFELNVPCKLCAQNALRFILRGRAVEDAQFEPRASYTCGFCLVGPSSPSSRSSARMAYQRTTSAAIDRVEGVTDEGDEYSNEGIIRAEDYVDPSLDKFKCDCCLHVVGTGTIAASSAAGPSVDFTAEIVCYRCTLKYKCCSDCGGGGGRLTIGRWRCVELFPMGRKTCRLSHARQAKMDELEWSVKAIPEIEASELDHIIDGCRSLYFTSRLQTTARPEVLEHGAALCSTYDQAEKLTIDGWNLVEPLFSQVIEHTRSIRRYLTLQTSLPSSRRAKSKAKSAQKGADEPMVAGFLLVEWDMLIGTIFIVCQMPWERTGDAYEAVTRCGTETMARVRADREQENNRRAHTGEQLLPELKCAWLLSPFGQGSRSYVSLRGRGYLPLEEVREDPAFAAWEERARSLGGAFPPDRKIHYPAEFVSVFHICVRLFDDADDLGGPPMVKRRPRKKKGSPTPQAPPSRRKR